MENVHVHVVAALIIAALGAGGDLVRSDHVSRLDARLESLERQLLALNSTLQNRISRTAVAFEVTCNRSPFTLYTNEIYKCDSVTLNIGGGYHAATGIFEAPVSGTYLFWASILPYNGHSVYAILYKEGRSLGLAHASVGSAASLSYIVRLTRGQKAWFQNLKQTSIWGFKHSTYGGTLIHQL
ncbi:multimerin-2-like [Haliotis rubra]|uniref:multimerin-2-like n=1 Tax=Haliotis rubra TaxID=36100 RepID=UPI001EE59FD7|nr:multimerin-2-like [Haliotis rubra]